MTNPAFNIDKVVSLLRPDGPLAKRLERYESRDGQLRMLGLVAGAFFSGRQVMVEAGTGIGKSIAYLLPAILFGQTNKTPVVISTNTRNLQEQLLNKDIPALIGALGQLAEVKVAVLKGRTNYLCLHRWESMRQGILEDDTGFRLIPRIAAWVGRTRTGDRAELTLNRHESYYWNKVSAGEGECLGEHCKHLKQGRCFLYQARQEARSAQLLVINHALLLADAASENKVLPPYLHLVVDEAHHLEEAATRQFGFELTSREADESYRDALQCLRDIDIGQRVSHLNALVKKDVSEFITTARAEIGNTRLKNNEVWSSIVGILGQGQRDGLLTDCTITLDSRVRHNQQWEMIEDLWNATAALMDQVSSTLGRLYVGLQSIDQKDLPVVESYRAGLTDSIEELQHLRLLLNESIAYPDKQKVYWISSRRTATASSKAVGNMTSRRRFLTSEKPDELANVSICAAPLEVASSLSATLFSEKETVVLTSATLTSAGDFNYMKRQLGYEPSEELVVDSPFDYLNTTLLCLPEDIPEPASPEYYDAVANAVALTALAAGGRTLVLFTSHEALKIVYGKLRQTLADEDICVLGQVIDGPPEQVLQVFREGSRMILLGTSSLWEGIDVVGEALSVLVIARLPFAVPTDPVQEARAQLFDDPFREYSLPQAVMKLKQGFGRLIRSRDDRGAVLILDRRVRSKAYGSVFINALPECRQASGTISELAEQIGEWVNCPHGPATSV